MIRPGQQNVYLRYLFDTRIQYMCDTDYGKDPLLHGAAAGTLTS